MGDLCETLDSTLGNTLGKAEAKQSSAVQQTNSYFVTRIEQRGREVKFW